MAEINNLEDIKTNFEKITNLINSMRAQGVLSFSGVDKVLTAINNKIDNLNLDENADLLKLLIGEVKSNIEERHGFVVSKFAEIESSINTLVKDNEEALKSTEIKKLFDVIATNLAVFSKEVVSQKDALTEITLRLESLRTDDTNKNDIIKNISTLISVNEIDNTRLLRSGQTLKIPSMDGVLHIADSGDSLEGISARYGVTVEDILDVNDLTEAALNVGQKLFIPGAVMDKQALRKALGELFAKPLSCSYRITSYFGPRADPFTGVASSHTGIDMAVSQGTPIKAAMGGKIAAVGFTNVYGYYVIINHENGYQTLYAHMLRKSPVNVGQRVSQGEQIGLVGSTGYSTGPHLHFTVYKNGKLIDPLSVLK